MSNTNRHKHDPMTQFARAIGCPVAIACDGATLRGARVAKGMCPACEDAQRKRGKAVEPRGLRAKI
jgi:hypothetical protein